MKIRKNDTITVLSGDDRGKTGKVLKVFPADKTIIVEGINFVKRHMRPTQKNPKGGILEKEGVIRVSKVMFKCPKCGEFAKLAHRRMQAEGSDEQNIARICKKCGEMV